jgi:hypothetical protein
VGRIVTLVLVDEGGALLGALPPFVVSVPWWQEVDELVTGARARDGVEVQVLRLLDGVPADGPTEGGSVRYLAQLSGRAEVGLAPVDVDLSAQPRRAPWAEPGGPAASTRWGIGALEALGSPGAVAVQRRSWNLSAIWRFDVAGRPIAWLKQVPGFLRHEPAVLGLVSGVAPGLVPPLLAAGEQGRMLLAHVPGEDGYGASAQVCAEIAAEFHPVQAHFAGRVDELLATGMPDRRLAVEPFAAVAEPFLARIDGLGALLDGLPRRLDEIAACGLPDTLLHGDLHPGNTRVGSGSPVLMDWGDSSVSHPAFDILRLTEWLTPSEAEELIASWALRWRTAVPGSDPARAAELMRPVAGLLGAVVYSGFLAGIEPAEHPYHRSDVPDCLTAAVEKGAVMS